MPKHSNMPSDSKGPLEGAKMRTKVHACDVFADAAADVQNLGWQAFRSCLQRSVSCRVVAAPGGGPALGVAYQCHHPITELAADFGAREEVELFAVPWREVGVFEADTPPRTVRERHRNGHGTQKLRHRRSETHTVQTAWQKPQFSTTPVDTTPQNGHR